MTDDLLIAIRDGIRAEMAAHMAGIREEISGIKREIREMRAHGCAIGAANTASINHIVSRLESLDARAAAAGGIVGAATGALVTIIDWFTRRTLGGGNV